LPKQEHKAQHKSKGGAPKAVQPKHKGSPERKSDAQKNHAQKKKGEKTADKAKPHEKHAAKAKIGEHAKKAAAKALARAESAGAGVLTPGVAAGDGVPVVPDLESVSLLHNVYQALQAVNHDYGGHRLRAMRHVGAALHHLGPSAPPRLGTGKGQMTVPQPVSDTILREARASLQRIRNRSAHAGANGALDQAMREIDLALTVR
jgi:hypothetical protein